MELLQAIFLRRSVRTFSDRDVEREKLAEICKAGVWAPTGGNSQPWLLIPVTKPETIKLIQTVSPGLLGKPKALIALFSDKKTNAEKMGPIGETLAQMDCCFAAENMLLAIQDLGLGGCVIRSFNQAAVRKVLGVPQRFEAELLIITGYPDAAPQAPTRRMDVIHWERFGGKDHE